MQFLAQMTCEELCRSQWCGPFMKAYPVEAGDRIDSVKERKKYTPRLNVAKSQSDDRTCLSKLVQDSPFLCSHKLTGCSAPFPAGNPPCVLLRLATVCEAGVCARGLRDVMFRV